MNIVFRLDHSGCQCCFGGNDALQEWLNLVMARSYNTFSNLRLNCAFDTILPPLSKYAERRML